MGMLMRIPYPDSVGKVRKILLFEATFHDSASGCTKLTLIYEGTPLLGVRKAYIDRLMCIDLTRLSSLPLLEVGETTEGPGVFGTVISRARLLACIGQKMLYGE